MLPQRSHITRKRGVFYYRRRMPLPHAGEVAVSLRTRNYREAEHVAGQLDAAFRRAWRAVNEQKSATVDVLAVVRDYLRRKLDHDMWVRTQLNPGQAIYTGQAAATPEVIDLEFIDAELDQARRELARRSYDAQRPLIDELMETHGVPAEQREALAHGVLRANVEALETIRDRTLGKFPPLTDPSPAPTIGRAPATTPSGPLLSAELPAFTKAMVEHEGWTGQTQLQNAATYRLFMEWCGDKPAAAYTKEDLASFRDALLRLPAMYGKDARWRRRPMPDVLRLSADLDVPRVTMKTAKRHFSALGRLFRWFQKARQARPDNPAHGFEFPTKRRAKGRRQMWEGERLTKLFSSPVWTGSHPHFRARPGPEIIRDDRFWLPLLGLFHGNRLEEFAQLRREDVKQAFGIDYLHIRDDGERQIKNEQSIRRVPVHPTILSLGFLAYVERTAPNAADMVFPELRPGGPDNKVGYYFTKWWTNYRRAVGVYDRLLDYHSFRTGVTTRLFDAGVDQGMVDELTGHEGRGTSRKHYDRPTERRLTVLREAISKVEWPEVDLSHLIVR